MERLLEFFHYEQDDHISDVDLHILQVLLLVATSSKIYTVSTVWFHKYRGSNVSVTNFMSRFSLFVPTKATMKLANGNRVNAQGISIILLFF